MNEANYCGRLAYGGGGWPPGRNDPAERALADEAIQLANAEAAVRLRQTGCPVASIFGLSPAVAQDDDPASAARRRAPPTTRSGRRASGCSATACCAYPAASRSSAETWPARST